MQRYKHLSRQNVRPLSEAAVLKTLWRLRGKWPNTELFLVRIFLYSDFSRNDAVFLFKSTYNKEKGFFLLESDIFRYVSWLP